MDRIETLRYSFTGYDRQNNQRILSVQESEEQELVWLARQNDGKAFAAIMDRYISKVHRLVRRILGSDLDADDVTQEIFIRVYQYLNTFKGDSKFSTWLYRIAVNHAIKRRKRWNWFNNTLPLDNVLEHPDTGDNPLQQTIKQDQSVLVHRLIQSLPVKQRTILILRTEHLLSFKEIAEIVGRTEGTVKSTYFRAIQKLQGLIEKADMPGKKRRWV